MQLQKEELYFCSADISILLSRWRHQFKTVCQEWPTSKLICNTAEFDFVEH